MGLFGFSFGKKRRSTKRKSAKKNAKPPARLLRICKKFHVKATKKVGRKRVYKSVATLKKLCLRKARAMKKKMMKMHKKSKMMKMHKKSKKVAKRKKVYRDAMFGSSRRVPMFGSMHSQMDDLKNMYGGMMNGQAFGKKRRVGASKKVAMKAFRSFYKRHCAGRRGMGFGNGGNPPLNASMGYEFCPDGMGGVLGVDSTGLFPSPCMSKSSSYGLRRRRSDEESEKPATRRRRSTATGVRRRRRSDEESEKPATRRRRCTTIGTRRKRRCTTIGTRRRTAAGVRRRRV